MTQPLSLLVVHNRYSSRVPSGENLAVDDEVRWLREAGIDVHLHSVSNDDAVDSHGIARLGQGMEAIWSLAARRKLERAIDRTKPDLVHVHNLFPLLSASVADGAARRLPVVWTVHNYRIVCVAGTYMRDGQPCHACAPGWRVPGIRHACYGGSTAASALVTGASSILRRTARRRLTAIAISCSVEDWLTSSAGIPSDRVLVKYNGIAHPPASTQLHDPATRRAFLFAGHLAEHKGVNLLLDAWRQLDDTDVELRIAGDGPAQATVRAAAAVDPRITFLGPLDPQHMSAEFGSARAVVVPSTWTEPFGRVAAEALAHGRPVVTTGTGGLAEIVDDSSGWITGRDALAIASALRSAATSDGEVHRRGTAASMRHGRLFSPAATTESLLQIYGTVIDRTTSEGSARRASAQ